MALSRVMAAGAAVLAASLFAGHPATQAAGAPWPNRPVRLLVGYAPGGSTDLIARAIAPVMSEQLGQPVVIENRPGASGIVASEALINSRDEHTLLINSSGGFSLRPHTTKLRFDPWKDMKPVSIVCTVPTIFLGSRKLPARTLGELVAYGRKNEGKLNFGVVGLGTTNHMFGELLKRDAGIRAANVVYPGLAPAVTALMAGDIDIVNVDAVDTVTPLLEDGRIVAYAVTTPERSPGFPEVPTAVESGFPSVVGRNSYAIYAPSGMAQSRVDRLREAIHAAVGSASVRAAFRRMKVVPETSATDDTLRMLRDEEAKFLPIVRTLDLRIE
ncbi:MAG: tripartite tricarboxylate transporter substrate binding protein [Xenophilus sp.]